MKQAILTLAIFCTCVQLNAQCKGKEFMRLEDFEKFPIDDSIAPIKTYRGLLENSGYKVGERVLDYTFAGTEGEMAMMASGDKPKLVVAGSYTCPIFRNKVSLLDSLYEKYRGLIEVYVVYTVEAHPNTDLCPYRDSVWITEQNIEANILYPQARTYDQRWRLAKQMKDEMSIKTPILIDNSANDFWNHFGPAPNNAYLLDKDGNVLAKNTWFDRDMIIEMKKLVATEAKQP